MRSEFDTLEQYQESMKEFNENTRMGFEEFIQSHGSDRNKLQLRCTPYTSKKGGYGSFDLDFGLCVYQHQQSKVDELEHKAKLRESDHKALLVKYQATKKCWEDISKEKEELQTQLSLQRQRVKAFEEELTSSRNYGDELQKRVDAALQLVNEMKGKRYPFSAYADQLEQALKGGSDE
ncbi:hypothetical protein [Acinetobacter junii]|uniref:hypothetical protein n=1 Tax=Acinetobacter junii TaxID=40215 RepID=UPI001BA98203|nr:hypothetical protein [Acinetobacter junii]QUS51132.1 hypothetical protein J5N61_05975 [Acinetobacter junii]